MSWSVPTDVLVYKIQNYSRVSETRVFLVFFRQQPETTLEQWVIPENIHTIPWVASWNSEGEGGGFLDWNSEGMGG